MTADAARESGGRTAEESVEEKAGRAPEPPNPASATTPDGTARTATPKPASPSAGRGHDDDEVSLRSMTSAMRTSRTYS
ncbi:hypothetical protein C9J85_03145 [Haloferax sp. wsp5]|nr:hypothetical protein C9J85_03145 [Haloferax sp. wsp5]